RHTRFSRDWSSDVCSSDLTQPVLFEADLTGGDALYLPRGVVHSAAAQRGVSLHLTVGVLATTVHDVLRELVDLAAEEVELRRSQIGRASCRERGSIPVVAV